MVTVSLDDKFLTENCEAIMVLKSLGFTDEQIQELYDKQVARDIKESEQHEENTHII